MKQYHDHVDQHAIFGLRRQHLEAIRYTLTRRDGLARFLDDGRIDLDNNAVL